MIFKINQASLAFEHLLKKARTKGKFVIFVSINLDSICTLRILTHLLNSNNAKYDIIPVISNEALESKLEKMKPHNSNTSCGIGVMVFVNCGGSIDMTKQWTQEEEIFIFLMDVIRPINHNNINDQKLIIVLDDDYYNYENCPTDEEINEFKEGYVSDEENHLEDADEVEDKEEQSDDGYEDLLKKDDTIKENKDDDDEVSQEKPVKKARIVTVKEKKREEAKKRKIIKKKQFNAKKAKIQSYYSGNSFGMPSAFIMYKVSNQLHQENPNLLWLSITASIYHYLSAHLTSDQYQTFYNDTDREAKRLNHNLGLNFKPDKTIIKDGENNDIEIQPETENRKPKCIFTEVDCKLLLYKFWNIYDSFIYSDFTVGHLQTWKEHGKNEINKILAIMGISIKEANQKFVYMKRSTKDLFKRKLPEITKIYLKDFLYDSFNFQFDETTQMSAGDFVNCINSILENPFNLEEIFYSNEGDDAEDLPASTAAAAEEHPDKEAEKEMDLQLNNFWMVYNFLSLKCSKLIFKAIDKAIEFQKAIYEIGTSIIDRNLISPSNSFRYAIIGDMSEQMQYFHNPLSFEKFALFVLNVYDRCRMSKVGYTSKPMIICLLNRETNSYLVAGVALKSKENEDDKNLLPFRFKVGASKSNAKILVNSFNDSIIEISKDEMLGFLDALISED